MLSNLIVTNQKLVLIIDELNRERIAQKFIGSLLHEQGQEVGSIKTLPIGMNLQHVASYETLLNECNGNNNNNNNNSVGGSEEPNTKCGYNIILPTLADLLCYQKPAFIFEFLNKLRRAEHVRRVFLWASPQHLQHEHAAYILAGCEYMAELVLRLEAETSLSLLTRKPGGGISNKRYTCQVSKTQFQVTPLGGGTTDALTTQSANDASDLKTTELRGTFKIELNENELAARNALTLPYERYTANGVKGAEPSSAFNIELDEDEMVARNVLTMPYERCEAGEGNIIYTPDADDDFDDEDPDEDLCI